MLKAQPGLIQTSKEPTDIIPTYSAIYAPPLEGIFLFLKIVFLAFAQSIDLIQT